MQSQDRLVRLGVALAVSYAVARASAIRATAPTWQRRPPLGNPTYPNTTVSFVTSATIPDRRSDARGFPPMRTRNRDRDDGLMRTMSPPRPARNATMVVLVIALALAGCSGGSGSGTAVSGGSSSGAGSAETTTEGTTTTTVPTVDRAVVRWKKRWGVKVQRPMRHAASVLYTSAVLAVNGDASATYRLTAAFNTLSNCRNPLDLPPLSPTPSVLRKAERLSLVACRQFYVGVNGVISGLNTGSSTATRAGLSRVHDGERTLRRAARLVRTAPITTL